MRNTWQIVIFSFFFALAGIALIPRLNVQYTPSGDSQFLRINYSGYGLSAEQLEREVCVPLESYVATMRGVKEIKSKTQDGSGSVDVELSRFVDVDFFRFDLSSRVRQLYPHFPDGVGYPVIEEVLDEKKNQYAEPILTYSISAPRPVPFLARYATETIAPQVGRLEGVSVVRFSGDRAKRIQIDLDPGVLAYHDLQIESINQVVNNAFENRAVGIWQQPDRTMMTVRLKGDYKPDSTNLLPFLRGIPIPTQNASVLTLGDAGDLYWKDEEVSAYYRINGQNALRLLIFPDPRANHIELAGVVKEEMERIQSTLQEDIHLTLEKDNTTFLKDELRKIYQRTGLSLLILLLFVVLFYFSWKPVVIIFSGILVNLGIAFILYYFLRIELNLYALAGITVTFGIIIDNSIVMIQHIRTQQNRRIFMALLAATLTTVSALIIIFFLPENLKVQLRYFALVIVINLIVSLIVSLFFVPALMHLLNYDRKQMVKYRALSWWDGFYTRYLLFTQRRRTWYIVFLILLFGLPIFRLPTQWSGHEWYNKTIGSTWYRDEGRPVVNKIFGGTLRLFVYHAYEHAGFRDQQETRLMIHCQMPEGSSLEQTNVLISYLENYLNKYQGPIKSFTTSIQGGGSALINVFFDPDVDLSFPYILKDRMVLFSSQFGGARWNISGVGQGYSNASGASPPNFSLQFIGYDREKIAEYSEVLKSRLEQHPRVRNVETNTSLSWFGGTKNVYEMNLNVHKMQQEGLSFIDFSQIMNYYNLRNDLMLQKPALPRIDYSIRCPGAGRWMLEHKPVLYRSQPYDLSKMVSYSKRQVAESIVKVNQEYVQGIKYEYTGSHRFGEKYLDEVMEEMKLVLPLGFRLEKKEFSYFLFSENTRSYGLLILIIGLILVISAIHFESFRWPFVIISIIPLSYIGIFLIFYFTGASFDQGGFTSFILVTGLTVNGLIYLLSDYKQLLNQGMSRIEAYKQAFEQKILPIFLTLLSTAAGLLPFALIGKDDAFWKSLAVGSIGGILFSFMVIVLFTPVFLRLDISDFP